MGSRCIERHRLSGDIPLAISILCSVGLSLLKSSTSRISYPTVTRIPPAKNIQVSARPGWRAGFRFNKEPELVNEITGYDKYLAGTNSISTAASLPGEHRFLSTPCQKSTPPSSSANVVIRISAVIPASGDLNLQHRVPEPAELRSNGSKPPIVGKPPKKPP